MAKETAPNRRYTDEYKQEALRLAEAVGINQAAQRLGMPASSLGNWMRRKRSGKLLAVPAATPMKGSSGELEAENNRLRRELANTKLDLGIAKKAAVGSTIQRNTFVLMRHFREGGRYGSNGTPRSFRFAEGRALATLEGWRIA